MAGSAHLIPFKDAQIMRNSPLFPVSSALAMILPLFGMFSLSACAQPANPAPGAAAVPGTPAHAARQTILSLSPGLVIERIADAALPGFQEVVVAGQVMYVSNDGRYLMQGKLYDIEQRAELGQSALSEVRRELLSAVPRGERIVFAPENPKYTVTVFTDVECGYCRRLHSEIGEYNKRGIAVEYLAFPRMGLDTDDYREMVSVWCASDRNQALTNAKNGTKVPSRTCANPVADHYALGQRLGLTGTPMIVTAEGVAMPGYLPPDALEETLKALAEK